MSDQPIVTEAQLEMQRLIAEREKVRIAEEEETERTRLREAGETRRHKGLDGQQRMWVRIVTCVTAVIISIIGAIALNSYANAGVPDNWQMVGTACVNSGKQWLQNSKGSYECVNR